MMNYFIYKQECIPVGCVPPARLPYAGVCFPGGGGGCGVYLPGRGGCLPGPGGVYLPGPGGVPAWSGGGVPGQVLPPPVDRMTHAYENITLPQTSFL